METYPRIAAIHSREEFAGVVNVVEYERPVPLKIDSVNNGRC